ncbi:MAG: SPFH/Band 7/PHB domain protein [Candidatus Muirbacterium halophilum]|nr:SPFH/Band 7/PHB domain protein [Candidatus Muirbacterium halophilum]MCK9474652.1 SPFH/Band 7/PHB domain protein [Candidatus Muirbacterium halophilum]
MSVILMVLGFLAIVFVIRGIVIVRQAEVIVVERLGKYNRTLQSGINVIIPVFEGVRNITWKVVKHNFQGESFHTTKEIFRIDLRETVYDFPRQNVITKDNVTLEINALLYFQITDSLKAVYEIANLPDAIEKLTQTTLRNVIGELDLDGTLASRDVINSKLRLILDEATDKWGIKVNRVELQDINPPKEIREAMEKQMRAERDKRAKILEAEGEKQSAILKAQGAREANILDAEGIKFANVLKAEGEAEARLKIAEAESQAIELITNKAGNSREALNYLVALKYIAAFDEIAKNPSDNKTVYMPYEISAVMSSIGGIKELFEKK